MSLNKRSKGFAGVVSQGWEVTEAYGSKSRSRSFSSDRIASLGRWVTPAAGGLSLQASLYCSASPMMMTRLSGRWSAMLPGVCPGRWTNTDCRPLRPHGEKHYRRKWTPEQGAAILNAAKGTLRDVAESLGIPYSSASIRRSWLLSRQGGGLTPETPAPEVNCLVQVSTS